MTNFVAICAQRECDGSRLCDTEGQRLNQEYVEAWQRGRKERDPDLDATVAVKCKLSRGPLAVEEIAKEQLVSRPRKSWTYPGRGSVSPYAQSC